VEALGLDPVYDEMSNDWGSCNGSSREERISS
jgi:hypothetical protein